jgi:hypothetical protein
MVDRLHWPASTTTKASQQKASRSELRMLYQPAHSPYKPPRHARGRHALGSDDVELARQNRLTRWLVIAIGGLLGVLVTSLAMRFLS